MVANFCAHRELDFGKIRCEELREVAADHGERTDGVRRPCSQEGSFQRAQSCGARNLVQNDSRFSILGACEDFVFQNQNIVIEKFEKLKKINGFARKFQENLEF